MASTIPMRSGNPALQADTFARAPAMPGADTMTLGGTVIDFIETGVERGAPKYMEWYGAFGLLVTLVWLYPEILRLLARLQSRRH